MTLLTPHLLHLLLLLPLTTALTLPHHLFDVITEQDTTLLAPQSCFPSTTFPHAAPVNETDLYMDAWRFCAGAAKQLPQMRPRALIKGDGRGASTEQHFEMRWVDDCPRAAEIKTQDTLDPLGKGKKSSLFGENWCVRILVDNWKKCKDFGGVGGSRVAGCVVFATGPGHLRS
ncbi:hypothetical protein CkaCkLH20_08925 [Colletotrichum karsti]|uniref:Uncharacterized protein n=1 Tax=Colletotrichum karsti TaxID=1095194 RepID=A0A9P6LHR9_9PEZI|nr:uncharacterized protein CkaCkLH20_08925 [Colletotrichum karsti]KAF9873466.1 hypothetical protein CkaCkLH20_08925 [Colletotrichum karsti]